MAPERRTTHYSGRVQGVGFRWRTRETLRGMPVAGYVQNLADGRVRLVLEAEPAAIDAALAAVRDALRGCIDDEDSRTGTATGEFVDFGIRR